MTTSDPQVSAGGASNTDERAESPVAGSVSDDESGVVRDEESTAADERLADRTDSDTDDTKTDAEPRMTEEGTTGEAAEDEPLVAQDAAVDLRARWEAIQQGFVDDPRAAVSDADALVRDLLDRLSTTFEDQRQGLEEQWNDGEPDTEQLRSALRRYRDFFDRLLSL